MVAKTVKINGEVYINLEDLKEVIRNHKEAVIDGVPPAITGIYSMAHDHIIEFLSIYDSPEIVPNK